MTGLALIGPASVDRYVDTGEHLPGGGALNMAYHWARAELQFSLISRVSDSDRSIFEPFLVHHGITTTNTLFSTGPSCSVDITIRADRQPWMDNFVEGVWSSFELSSVELAEVRSGKLAHLVLVDVVDREVHRRAGAGQLGGARLSGDFLSLRHFTNEGFVATLALLEIGFVGWPGDPGDDRVDELASAVDGNVLVITFGSAGVRVIDGRDGPIVDHWFDVDPVAVAGTTVGCGDAFIAAFLAAWVHTDGSITASIERGMRAGAAATAWMRPLPDDAYAGLVS